MSKKYNIEKRSDMQRFHRDMMKKIECIAEQKAKSIYEEDHMQNLNFYGTVFSHSMLNVQIVITKYLQQWDIVCVQFAGKQSA